jgi:lysophospholipase L1-like esterase
MQSREQANRAGLRTTGARTMFAVTVAALSATAFTGALTSCRQQSVAGDASSPDGASGGALPVNFAPVVIAATDPRVGLMGRVVSDGSRIEFGFPGVTTRVCFRGNRIWLTGSSNQGRSHLAVVHQGRQVGEVVVPKVEAQVLVWEAPSHAPVGEHCVDVVHLTETWIGVVHLTSFRVEGEVLEAAPFPARRLLFIGDSVTCGEAVRRKPECSKDETWWDAYDAYGPVAARSLKAQFQLVCFGGKGVVRDWQGKTDVLNAPEFFPLAIPDERKLPYALGNYTPDAIVVSLGTNDFNPALGAFPQRRDFVDKYANFVRTLLATYPGAQIWLTEGAIVSDENVEPKGATAGTTGGKQKATLRSYLEEVVSQVGASQVRHLPATHYPADTCDPHPLASEHTNMAKDVVSGIRFELGW